MPRSIFHGKPVSFAIATMQNIIEKLESNEAYEQDFVTAQYVLDKMYHVPEMREVINRYVALISSIASEEGCVFDARILIVDSKAVH